MTGRVRIEEKVDEIFRFSWRHDLLTVCLWMLLKTETDNWKEKMFVSSSKLEIILGEAQRPGQNSLCTVHIYLFTLPALLPGIESEKGLRWKIDVTKDKEKEIISFSYAPILPQWLGPISFLVFTTRFFCGPFPTHFLP